MSESICVTDDYSSTSFDSLSSCHTLWDKLAHLCVLSVCVCESARVCACMCMFMCDLRQVPASMTRFHHL